MNTNNTVSCDDGDACTTADTCSAGACVGGSAPDCDDSNVCTDDSCNPASGCVNTNNTVSCDDGRCLYHGRYAVQRVHVSGGPALGL